jgi:predicted nucleic acid-binding Zn ribbon protein
MELVRDEKHCRLCGAPIAGLSFIREGEECCCEDCFLKRKEFRGIEAERDNAYLALAEALAAALDAREHETGLHSKRVACHTLVLGRRFTGEAERLRQVYWGALLHDLGKIGITDAILLKSGPLTENEWAIMRTHPEIGHRILAVVPSMAEAAEIVLSHEERFDGTGLSTGTGGRCHPSRGEAVRGDRHAGCHDLRPPISERHVVRCRQIGDPAPVRHPARPAGGIGISGSRAGAARNGGFEEHSAASGQDGRRNG